MKSVILKIAGIICVLFAFEAGACNFELQGSYSYRNDETFFGFSERFCNFVEQVNRKGVPAIIAEEDDDDCDDCDDGDPTWFPAAPYSVKITENGIIIRKISQDQVSEIMHARSSSWNRSSIYSISDINQFSSYDLRDKVRDEARQLQSSRFLKDYHSRNSGYERVDGMSFIVVPRAR